LFIVIACDLQTTLRFMIHAKFEQLSELSILVCTCLASILEYSLSIFWIETTL
jgi:hypothetical protein